MEQIITKADIYKWITKIKETLTRHLQLVFNELTNDDVFCMLILNSTLQKELQEAVIWRYRKDDFFDIEYLCDNIINICNFNTGVSLLECVPICDKIIQQINQRYDNESPPLKKETEYINNVSNISNSLNRLKETLILEFPDKQNDINKAIKAIDNERNEQENVEYAEKLKQFFINEAAYFDFINYIKGQIPLTVAKYANTFYIKDKKIIINKNAKDKTQNTSIKAFWECLNKLGYYTQGYKTFTDTFGDPKKVIPLS